MDAHPHGEWSTIDTGFADAIGVCLRGRIAISNASGGRKEQIGVAFRAPGAETEFTGASSAGLSFKGRNVSNTQSGLRQDSYICVAADAGRVEMRWSTRNWRYMSPRGAYGQVVIWLDKVILAD